MIGFLAQALAAGAVLVQTAVVPVPPQDPDPGDSVAEVVVQARREQTVRDFVGSVAMTNGVDGQLAIFDRRVCPGVVNMRREYAEVIADRIGRAALLAGLDVGGPGCSPNIIVVAATDVANVMPALLRRFPGPFQTNARDVNDGRQHLAAFLANDRPVRWWHVTAQTPAGGQGESFNGVETWRKTGSRFVSAARTEIFTAIVVIDMDRVGQVNLVALADYAALVALARVNPEAETGGADTILNLFAADDAARPTELTQFDIDYLEGLYRAPVDAVEARYQESAITSRMMQRSRQPAEPAEAD